MRARRTLSMLMLVAACGGPAADASTTTTSTTLSTSIPPSSTTTTTLPDGGLGTDRPDATGIIAYGRLADGEPAVAWLDPPGIIVDWDQLAEGAGELHLDAPTGTLYLSRVATSCSSEVLAVDVATGAMSVAASGTSPVVSPDGRYLAHAVDPVCRRHDDVHVRDLANGSELVWVSELDESSDLLAAVARLAWAPDGVGLAVEVVLEDGIEIRILDTSVAGGSLFDALRLTPPDKFQWTSPVYAADGSLFVVESCCGMSTSQYRLVRIDPASSSTSVVVELPGPGRLVDVHPTDDRLLLTISTSGETTDLWMFDGRELVPVATDIGDAVWWVPHGSPVES